MSAGKYIVGAVLLYGVASCIHNENNPPQNFIEGRVVEEYFPEGGDSYLKVTGRSGETNKLHIDTATPGLYIGGTSGSRFHGKADSLDDQINEGDIVRVRVNESSGIERSVREIMSVSKGK